MPELERDLNYMLGQIDQRLENIERVMSHLPCENNTALVKETSFEVKRLNQWREKMNGASTFTRQQSVRFRHIIITAVLSSLLTGIFGLLIALTV